MGKKSSRRLLTNARAQRMSEDELIEIICDYYKQVNSRSELSEVERKNLRFFAQDIQEGRVLWSRVEDAIADRWDARTGDFGFYSVI